MKTAICVILLAAASCVCAQSVVPELALPAAKYNADIAALESQRTAAIAQAQKPYIAALAAAEKNASTSGNVAGVATITSERAALTSGLMTPGFPPGMPKELQNPRKTYLDAVARIRAAEAPRRLALDSAYLRALTTLSAKAPKESELAKQLEAEKQKLIASSPSISGGKSGSKSVVVNGTFDMSDEKGIPRGWSGTEGEGFKVVRDGRNNVLHASIKAYGYPSLRQEIPVPPRARNVTLSGRIRGKMASRQQAKPDYGPKLAAVFLDSQDSVTKNWLYFPPEINPEWKTMSLTDKVPDDMKTLQVILEVKNCIGDFDFDDIVVEFR